MEPVAKTLLDSWRLVRQRLAERALSNENLQTVLPSVDEAIQIVEHMYPELKQPQETPKPQAAE
jgi:hypothetical protein